MLKILVIFSIVFSIQSAWAAKYKCFGEVNGEAFDLELDVSDSAYEPHTNYTSYFAGDLYRVNWNQGVLSIQLKEEGTHNYKKVAQIIYGDSISYLSEKPVPTEVHCDKINRP